MFIIIYIYYNKINILFKFKYKVIHKKKIHLTFIVFNIFMYFYSIQHTVL
jgi:hypothetical protein